MTKIITLLLVASVLCSVSCKPRAVEAASNASVSAVKSPSSAYKIKPETKVRLLVFQARLASIEKAIDESPFGQQRRELSPKFQSALADARQDCHGGEPSFGDDDVICAAPPKK